MKKNKVKERVTNKVKIRENKRFEKSQEIGLIERNQGKYIEEQEKQKEMSCNHKEIKYLLTIVGIGQSYDIK